MVYWTAEAIARNKANARYIRRYQWRPGVSGNIRGRPPGIREWHQRRRGIDIRGMREERREEASAITEDIEARYGTPNGKGAASLK